MFPSDGRMILGGVPLLTITHNAESITREVKTPGTATVTNANGSAYPLAELFDNNITIKGRGNSTWLNPKVPYNIVLMDSANKKTPYPVMGLPAEYDYCLLADYRDKTFFRNALASAISYALGLPWASRMRKVEIVMNGTYLGLFTFAEKVKSGPTRIAITDIKKTDLAGEALTGGYVIEQLSAYQIAPEEQPFSFVDSRGFSFLPKVPDADAYKPAQIAYIKGTWDAFIYALYNHPLDDLVNGYRAHIDVDSFVRFRLMQDLVKNLDIHNNSWYTTKDRNGKLVAGPGWDFDISLAIVNQAEFTGTQIDWAKAGDSIVDQKCPYYAKLMTDPYFVQRTREIFEAALPALNQVLADLPVYAAELEATGAPDRDRALWTATPVDADLIPLGSYKAEADRIIDFFRERLYYHTRSLYVKAVPKPIFTNPTVAPKPVSYA